MKTDTNIELDKMASIESAQHVIKRMIMSAKYDLTVNRYKPVGKLLKAWEKATENLATYLQSFAFVEAMTHETEVIQWLNDNGFGKYLEDEQLYTVRTIIDRAVYYNDRITLDTLKTIYPLDGFFSCQTLPTTTSPRYDHHYKITVKPWKGERTGIVYYNVSKLVHDALASQHVYLHLSRSEEYISTQWSHPSAIAKHLSFALYGVWDGLESWSDHFVLE